jgi:hypothetical protein
MSNFYSPTRIEFDSAEEAGIYEVLVKRAMGSTFEIIREENVVQLKRPIISFIHESCLKAAKETIEMAESIDSKQKNLIGTRVFAVRDEDEENVYLFGFGTYEGTEVPDAYATGLARHVRESGVPNPKIKLDDGSIVWGCECWWGAEKDFTSSGKTVVKVDINFCRMEQRNELN